MDLFLFVDVKLQLLKDEAIIADRAKRRTDEDASK